MTRGRIVDRSRELVHCQFIMIYLKGAPRNNLHPSIPSAGGIILQSRHGSRQPLPSCRDFSRISRIQRRFATRSIHAMFSEVSENVGPLGRKVVRGACFDQNSSGRRRACSTSNILPIPAAHSRNFNVISRHDRSVKNPS